MTFQISALDPSAFANLFPLSDQELAQRKALRVIAAGDGGFPCRVSLEQARSRDELLLINFRHQPVESPYEASHAIYVRKGAAQARPGLDEIPPVLRSGVFSLRAFDRKAMIVAAELADAGQLARMIDRLLHAPGSAYVHIHFARYGCYAARADRR